MAYIIKRKWRSFLSIVLIVVIPLGTLVWSTASARTKRFAKIGEATPNAARTPQYVDAGFTFQRRFAWFARQFPRPRA